jgi:hypothetical protein
MLANSLIEHLRHAHSLTRCASTRLGEFQRRVANQHRQLALSCSFLYSTAWVIIHSIMLVSVREGGTLHAGCSGTALHSCTYMYGVISRRATRGAWKCDDDSRDDANDESEELHTRRPSPHMMPSWFNFPSLPSHHVRMSMESLTLSLAQ